MRVVPIDEKMRENRLRWFGHMQRRAINSLVRMSDFIQIERTKRDRKKRLLLLLPLYCYMSKLND